MSTSVELGGLPPTARDGGGTLLAWLRHMRAENPVWRDAYGSWHVFRYADVARVLADPRGFSSDVARIRPGTRKLSVGNLLVTDPPHHQRLRRLVGGAFSPKVVTGLTGRIAELTHKLLDDTGDDREFDLVDTLAYPLPVTVIAELLGLPTADRELFRLWADKLLTLDVADPRDPERERKVDEASAELLAYLGEHCTDRRAHPREDLISKLTTAEVDGQQLTDAEVVNFSLVLLLAGHVTTTGLLGNFVLCVEEHPRVWAQLRADRSLVEGAIEEVLRYRSPVTQLARVSTAETELGGQVIPADALVSPWLLSANRDDREFDDPDRFDIHRGTQRHAAFGYGIHFCIGQLLARVEARVVLGVLLDRYTQLRVVPAAPVEFFERGLFAPRTLLVAAS